MPLVQPVPDVQVGPPVHTPVSWVQCSPPVQEPPCVQPALWVQTSPPVQLVCFVQIPLSVWPGVFVHCVALVQVLLVVQFVSVHDPFVQLPKAVSIQPEAGRAVIKLQIHPAVQELSSVGKVGMAQATPVVAKTEYPLTTARPDRPWDSIAIKSASAGP